MSNFIDFSMLLFVYLSAKFESIKERLDFIEFRQELLFNNSEVDRMLFQNNITRQQYVSIMNLMDDYRKRLANKEKVLHGSFEQGIYDIVDHLDNNYHFCEYTTRAFMNEDRWEEVFPALYWDMPKYKGI